MNTQESPFSRLISVTLSCYVTEAHAELLPRKAFKAVEVPTLLGIACASCGPACRALRGGRRRSGEPIRYRPTLASNRKEKCGADAGAEEYRS
jgi:hypothetical protein